MSKQLTFILDGARSGKSSYAEQLAQADDSVLFVATAEVGDEKMSTRIDSYQSSRPRCVEHAEEPLDLAEQIGERHYNIILLDCLTLWVSNLQPDATRV